MSAHAQRGEAVTRGSLADGQGEKKLVRVEPCLVRIRIPADLFPQTRGVRDER